MNLIEETNKIIEAAKQESMPPKSRRKRIEAEDDLVKVYQGNKEIYSGTEDYEPMNDADWRWDNNDKCYKYDKYIKICFESKTNEDNASELKKELEYLYRGIGWAEWDYFKEGLATTNFKPNGMSDKDLEKMINASGIAKVKKVRDIKNYQSMEDFDPKDFKPDDKIIVTKKPMSAKYHGEALKKNEDWDGDMNKAIEEGCKAYLRAYLEVCKKHNAAVYAPHFEQNAAMQAGIGLKDNFILPILRRLCKSYPTYKSAKEMPSAIKRDAIEQITDYLNVDSATTKLLDDCDNCFAEPAMSNIIDSCIKNSGSFIKL